MSAWVWLPKPLVLAIHDRQLAQHGGASGVRDEALLDSALARPLNLAAYGAGDAAAFAAAYAFGIVRNHPFVDGNKRTGYLSAELFLVANGLRLQTNDEAIVTNTLALASGDLDEAAFAAWLRAHAEPR